MTQLDSRPPVLTYPIASHSDPQPDHRLIVLLPASEPDSPDLAHRIWKIARSLKADVLLFSLTNNYEEEAQLRRSLITMAAIIKDLDTGADILIEHGNDWVKGIRQIWRRGDTIACYDGQKTGLMRKPLDQILKSNLEAPIYLLSRYQPARNPKPAFILHASAWLGSLAIIAGFLWAEIKIVQLPQDWIHTAAIYVCILVEIILILLWNSLFS